MKFKTRYKVTLLAVALAAITYVALVAARILNYTTASLEPHDLTMGLLAAAREDDLVGVFVLLLLGAEPDLPPNDFGNLTWAHRPTPLSIASHRGNLRIVRLLLWKGADPELAKLNGESGRYFDELELGSVRWDKYYPENPPSAHFLDRPLSLAAVAGHEDVAQLLIEHGANYRLCDAIFLGDESFIRKQFENFPRLSETITYETSDCFMLATEHNNIIAANLFLDLGGDPTYPDKRNSPLGIARRRNYFELLELFEAWVRANPPDENP